MYACFPSVNGGALLGWRRSPFSPLHHQTVAWPPVLWLMACIRPYRHLLFTQRTLPTRSKTADIRPGGRRPGRGDGFPPAGERSAGRRRPLSAALPRARLASVFSAGGGDSLAPLASELEGAAPANGGAGKTRAVPRVHLPHTHTHALSHTHTK